MKMRPASQHLPFLFVMAVLALLRAATAAGQYYTPYLQERSLEVRADAQVPPQESSPVVSDGRREESSDLGGFDGALAASAEAGQSASQPPYASGEARAAQTVAYTPTGFTGRFFSGFTLDENGGWSGGSRRTRGRRAPRRTPNGALPSPGPVPGRESPPHRAPGCDGPPRRPESRHIAPMCRTPPPMRSPHSRCAAIRVVRRLHPQDG